MLRTIRLIAAMACFALITLLFLDFTGTLHGWFGWLAKIQFLPALLALNVGAVLFLVFLTLLLGRVYCSVVCPLGVYQDIVSWMAARRKKRRFHYAPAARWWRYGILGLFVAAMVAGFTSLALLIAPYSAYGRMVTALLSPLWKWGNNLLAYVAVRMDSYAFYEVEVWLKSLPLLVVAVVTLVVVSVWAWRSGRGYCNTVCPVGTLLGFLAKYSLYKPQFQADNCNSCGLCARNCKAACIDIPNREIDYTRCVSCMNCIDTCKRNGMRYVRSLAATPKAPAPATPVGSVDSDRRTFLTVSAMAAAGSVLKSQEKLVDGGLAVIEEKVRPEREHRLLPPGAQSVRHFSQHCTGCQLCVAACPNEVLRPSDGLMTFMQPEMSYEQGYCRPECTKCSEVCPTGAILPLTTADKSATQIGHAVWVKENCVPLTDGVACGNCARHCPTGAIQMVPSDPETPLSPEIPVVNVETCIGCGACEYLCPARPFTAIYVTGYRMHRVV